MPLVTVIVPCYNHEQYVETCLDSIFRQSYTNIEVIVIDDCSPDNSVAVIKRLQEKYDFKFIEHKENWGLTKTLNDVIYNHAHGKYIKCIASDDSLTDDCVEVLLNKLEHLGDSHAFVYGQAKLFKYDIESKKNITCGIIGRATDFINLYCQRENLIPAMCVLFSKEKFILSEGFDENSFAEDFYMWLTLGSRYEFEFVNKIVANYRIDTSLSMSKNNIKMRSSVIYILTKIFVQNSSRISPETYFSNIEHQIKNYKIVSLYSKIKTDRKQAIIDYWRNFFYFIYKSPRTVFAFWKQFLLAK